MPNKHKDLYYFAVGRNKSACRYRRQAGAALIMWTIFEFIPWFHRWTFRLPYVVLTKLSNIDCCEPVSSLQLNTPLPHAMPCHASFVLSSRSRSSCPRKPSCLARTRDCQPVEIVSKITLIPSRQPILTSSNGP